MGEPSNAVFLPFNKAELKQLVVFWGGTETSAHKKGDLQDLAIQLASEQGVTFTLKPAPAPVSESESEPELSFQEQLTLKKIKYEFVNLKGKG